MKRDKQLGRIGLFSMVALASSTMVYGAQALPMTSHFIVNDMEVGVEAYTIEGSELAIDSDSVQEAVISSSKVYKDGEMADLLAYKIGDSNYFKLRDVGELLDVDVAWIGETNTVKVSVSASSSQEGVKDTVTIYKDALNLPVKDIVSYPSNQAEYENILLYMMNANLDTYEVEYNRGMYDSIVSGELQEVIKAAYTEVFSKYIEQFGSLEGLGINIEGNQKGGTITLKLQPINGYSLKVIKEEFLNDCMSIVEELIRKGKLTNTMTEKEKARVLYEWVISNIETDVQKSDISRMGYGALKNKKAVCQGYTAIYNMLCKLVGIEVRGVVGTAGTARVDHSWTLATLDGEKVYIDVTYGDLVSDQRGVCDYRYFMAKEEFLSSDHFWDKSIIYKN